MQKVFGKDNFLVHLCIVVDMCLYTCKNQRITRVYKITFYLMSILKSDLKVARFWELISLRYGNNERIHGNICIDNFHSPFSRIQLRVFFRHCLEPYSQFESSASESVAKVIFKELLCVLLYNSVCCYFQFWRYIFFFSQ